MVSAPGAAGAIDFTGRPAETGVPPHGDRTQPQVSNDTCERKKCCGDLHSEDILV